MTGTVTAFGTTADLSPLLTPSPVDDLTTTNTTPGTLLTSAPGIWFDIPPNASVSVNQSNPYLAEIPLLTVPEICMVVGNIWYEIWLTSGGYMCGIESINFSSGISQTVNMSLPNSAIGSSPQHYRANVVNANDPIPTGLTMTYGSTWGISLCTGFVNGATIPLSYGITGGRVCFMGMMYSNP